MAPLRLMSRATNRREPEGYSYNRPYTGATGSFACAVTLVIDDPLLAGHALQHTSVDCNSNLSSIEGLCNLRCIF